MTRVRSASSSHTTSSKLVPASHNNRPAVIAPQPGPLFVAGQPMTVPPPANVTCDLGPCTVQALINGQLYNINDTINLPAGTTPITYVITDKAGRSTTSPTLATIVGPPKVDAPAPLNIATANPDGTTVIPPLPTSQYCGLPNCTVCGAVCSSAVCALARNVFVSEEFACLPGVACTMHTRVGSVRKPTQASLPLRPCAGHCDRERNRVPARHAGASPCGQQHYSVQDH